MSVLRKIVTAFYQPVIRRKIHRTSFYTYEGIRLCIPPGIFHPKYFHSTEFLLKHIVNYDLQGKHFLELGAGSGLISFVAARAGALVTAVDINPNVVENMLENARSNNITLEILESDLFSALEGRYFDHIVINPPYYPKDPKNTFEQAWYCGEDHTYFRKLFPQLRLYMEATTHVDMVLSESCDISEIQKIAQHAGIYCTQTRSESKLWETHYIFELQRRD